MKTWITNSNEINELISCLKVAELDERTQGVLAMVCLESLEDRKVLDAALKIFKKPVFGGVFPGLIYKGGVSHVGGIVVGIGHALRVETFTQIDQMSADETEASFEHNLEQFALAVMAYPTAAVFIDGLSEGVDRFKDALLFNMGLDHHYFGGGAGLMSFERAPCVITNQGLLEDAAVVAMVDCQAGIGVAHGWAPVSEVLKVTESKGTHIQSLNWENAFEVYKQYVQRLSGLSFEDYDFFEIVKSYPFGISKLGNEMVVRDPVRLESSGEIVCVGEVPINSFVYILKGDKASLIMGAKEAKALAEKDFAVQGDHHKEIQLNHPNEQQRGKAFTLVIDCISRALYLGDDFIEEVAVLGDASIVGALTIGEIANSGKSYLELFNKTSVVAILEA